MLINRRTLVLGLGAVGGAGVASLALGPGLFKAEAGTTLSPQDAFAAVTAGEILLVDVRRPDEWARTGIAQGATPIDMRRPDFIEAVLIARQSSTQPIAVICARGVRSNRMAQQLLSAGLAPILDVPQGMLGSFSGPGWIAAGLPVTQWTE